jgi:hypothetical protein
MVLITPTTSLIVLAIVLLITLYITFTTSSTNFESTRSYVFMTVLAGLGVFITFLFYYGVVELNMIEQQLAKVQETARTDDLNNKMMNVITDAVDIVPGFVASLTPIQNKGSSYLDKADDTTNNRKLAVSYTIFSVWQDMFIADRFTGNEPASYVSNYLQRANSTQLYEQWKLSYIDFNRSTQILGDLLFEYALPIKDHRPEVYHEVAKKYIKDPRYKRVYA